MKVEAIWAFNRRFNSILAKCTSAAFRSNIYFKYNRLYSLKGNSGSPLVCRNSSGTRKLFGVYQGNVPGEKTMVFFRVRHFRDWIASKREEVEEKLKTGDSNVESVITSSMLLTGIVAMVVRYFAVNYLF